MLGLWKRWRICCGHAPLQDLISSIPEQAGFRCQNQRMPEQPLGRICITHSEKMTWDQTYCTVGETWRTAQALLNRNYWIYWSKIGAWGLVINLACTFLQDISMCGNQSLFCLNTSPVVHIYTFDVLFSSFDFALQCSCYLWETSGECLIAFIKCFIKSALLKQNQNQITAIKFSHLKYLKPLKIGLCPGARTREC